LKSVIINMADRMKDIEDSKLESLFASDPIADDGFSIRVEKRIRRQMWVRRLALPIALLVGGAIALKPLAGLVMQLLNFATVLSTSVSSSLGGLSASSLPQYSTVIFGGLLALAFVVVTRLLEEW